MENITIECSICLNNLDNNIITLHCNHKYHNECMDMWLKYNNTCPYCRYNLKRDRIPSVLYDKIIGPDGDLESLNVNNFNYFYYINPEAYTDEQRAQFINEIKLAKQLKDTLRIGQKYKITGLDKDEGILTRITQINSHGTFCCEFNTNKGIRYYYNNLHKFNLI